MALHPTKLLSRPITIRSVILCQFLVLYVAATFAIFYMAVVPSFEEGTTSDTFAVDSSVYVYMADSLREGRNEPWVLAALAHFPNTLWTPVFISFILNSPLLVMLANYAIFFTSIVLLKRGCSISIAVFLPLLLMNPTTTTSILCVNKEVLDLFCFSLFLYSRKRRQHWLVLIALGFALLNRWETCIVMVVILIAESPLNPLRRRRLGTLFLLIVALNFAMPLLAGDVLVGRFEEAATGNTIAFLDNLQMHYLYVLAFVPKIAENLFGQILNSQVWEVGSSWLLINLFNNIATAILMAIAARKRLLTLRNDFVYFGAIGAVIMAQSLAIQPRYFYFIYVLVCIQVAQIKSSDDPSPHKQGVKDHKASLISRGEVAFG